VCVKCDIVSCSSLVILLFEGVIVFGSDQEVKALMRAVGRRNATGGNFAWIGSDGWSARTLVSDGNEAVVEGTLSVQPRANPVKGFDDYFFSLSVKNNTRNPWFVGKCVC
jgi:metabotropic X receptor